MNCNEPKGEYAAFECKDARYKSVRLDGWLIADADAEDPSFRWLFRYVFTLAFFFFSFFTRRKNVLYPVLNEARKPEGLMLLRLRFLYTQIEHFSLPFPFFFCKHNFDRPGET